MQGIPRPAAAFVALVVAGGGALLGQGAPYLFARAGGSGSSLVEVGVFLALAVLADLRRLPLGSHAAVSVATAVNFGAVIVLGPETATWTAAMSMATADATRRRPAYKLAFNAATTALSVAAGGHAFAAVRAQVGGPLAAHALPALVAYAGVNLFVNHVLVCAAIGLATGASPWEVAQANLRDLVVTLVALYPLGLLLAVSHNTFGPWVGLGLLVVPTVAVHRGLVAARDLRAQAREALEALADALDQRDRYTDQHSRRVAGYAGHIAAALRLPLAERETLLAAARLHDLGKIHVPDAVLRKQGPLTDEEWDVMRTHPEVGAAILRKLRMYRASAELVARHHERPDGRGYPGALADGGARGGAVTRGAQILAVADAYDAMTSDRPYRQGLPAPVAIARLRSGAGTQFAPSIVEALAGSLGYPPPSEVSGAAEVGAGAAANARTIATAPA
jgi:putative nucleotidyltransferase with HDIG domain